MYTFLKTWLSRKHSRLLWLGIMASLIAAIYGFYRYQESQNAAQGTLTAERAGLWDAELTDLEGDVRTLAKYKGHMLVINFWGSWCEPCLQEIPAFVAAQKKYKSKRVQFIGIAVDTAENVIEFTRIFRVNYPIYIAGFEGAQLARDLGNVQGGLPFTVIIDAAGNVRRTVLGKITAEKLEAELALLTEPIGEHV